MVFTSTISPSVKIGLRFFGALPDVPYAVVNRVLYLLAMLIAQYFQYQYLFAHLYLDELQDLVDSLPATIDYSLSIVKLITLWKYHRVLHDILTTMDSDWRECVNIDRHLQLMTRKASISHFCSNAIFGLYTLAGGLYVVGDMALTNAHLAASGNITSRPLPIKILFPFDVEQSPIYELLSVVLFVQAMLNVYTVIIVNALLFTLVFHASGQIDIIREEFKTISEGIPYYGSPGTKIGMLIKRHNKVILFSENIDKLFSFITLAQVFFNTIVVCALGLLFMTSVGETGVELVRSVLAYVAIMMEIFLICFVGEYLSLKSKSLADAAYNSLWYNMSLHDEKTILFVIMRCQKQLTITAGGMGNLSLEAFASVLYVSGQIDIIFEELKTMSKEIYYGFSGHTIGILVEGHNKVILFCDNVNKLFSFITLAQIFFNTIIICALRLLFVTIIKTSASYVSVVHAMY